MGLFETFIDPGLTYIRKHCSQAIDQVITDTINVIIIILKIIVLHDSAFVTCRDGPE